MDKFKNFLSEVFSYYAHIILAEDLNLPRISWNSLETTTRVRENTFIKLLYGYFLVPLIIAPLLFLLYKNDLPCSIVTCDQDI